MDSLMFSAMKYVALEEDSGQQTLALLQLLQFAIGQLHILAV